MSKVGGRGGAARKIPQRKKGPKKGSKKQSAVPAAVVAQPGRKYHGNAGSAVVEKCACVSPFQDRLYGPGMRVKNKKRDGGTTCTVCAK